MGHPLIAAAHLTKTHGSTCYRAAWGYNAGNAGGLDDDYETWSLVSVYGVVTHMNVKLSGIPGDGEYIECTLMRNGYATPIKVTISDSDTEGFDRSLVTVSPGDRIYVRVRGSGDAVQRYPSISLWLYTLSDTESHLSGAKSDHTLIGSYYITLMGLGCSSSSTHIRALTARAATLSNLMVRSRYAPGSGKTTTYTLRKNGVNTELSASISGTDTTGADIGNYVSVNPGDYIDIYRTSNTSIGTEEYVSVKALTDANQLLFGGAIPLAGVYGSYLPMYSSAIRSDHYGSAQQYFMTSANDMYLNRFEVHLNNPPGAGKSIVVSLMKYISEGTDEVELVTIENTDTEGSCNLNELLPRGSKFCLHWTQPDGDTNSGQAIFGFAASVFPSPPAVTTDRAVRTTVHGAITSVGDGDSCSVRGFCYMEGLVGDPNIFDNSYEVDGSLSTDGEFGVGEYSLEMPFESGKYYRVRAFVVNDTCLAYGDTIPANYNNYPSDPMARVSAIRRIFHPGLYQMEVALGDLGFEWDVSELAMRSIDEGVSEEPKEVVDLTSEEVERAKQRFIEESWPKAVESLDIMTTLPSDWPVVSGKWTAPQRRPKITMTDPVTGEPISTTPPTTPSAITPKRKFLVTYMSGRTVIVEAEFDLATRNIPGVASIVEVK